MKLSEKLREKKIRLSCEVFPPKSGSELENAIATVEEIATLQPEFISVTYGAGGTNVGQMLAIAEKIQKTGVLPLAHLTCINADDTLIEDTVGQLQRRGIENILALRGDLAPGQVTANGRYQHARDLVEKIKSMGEFCVGGACYPEGHPEASSLDADILHVKEKVDAGCEFLVTQMVFDNTELYKYMYRLLARGVDVPVLPGIMPVTNVKQIARICELSGTKLPPTYRAIMEKFANDKDAMFQAGISYATGQIIDLIANGFTDIHVYTMNRPEIMRAIRDNISEILE